MPAIRANSHAALLEITLEERIERFRTTGANFAQLAGAIGNSVHDSRSRIGHNSKPLRITPKSGDIGYSRNLSETHLILAQEYFNGVGPWGATY